MEEKDRENEKFHTGGKCAKCGTPVEVICPCEVKNFREVSND